MSFPAILGALSDMRTEFDRRLSQIEKTLRRVADVRADKQYFTVREFARLVGCREDTVRSWARLGRIAATRTRSGRGGRSELRISREELLRYEAEGLLGGSDDPK
jgi:excisionase family DNA binding protein